MIVGSLPYFLLEVKSLLNFQLDDDDDATTLESILGMLFNPTEDQVSIRMSSILLSLFGLYLFGTIALIKLCIIAITLSFRTIDAVDVKVCPRVVHNWLNYRESRFGLVQDSM